MHALGACLPGCPWCALADVDEDQAADVEGQAADVDEWIRWRPEDADEDQALPELLADKLRRGEQLGPGELGEGRRAR